MRVESGLWKCDETWIRRITSFELLCRHDNATWRLSLVSAGSLSWININPKYDTSSEIVRQYLE